MMSREFTGKLLLVALGSACLLLLSWSFKRSSSAQTHTASFERTLPKGRPVAAQAVPVSSPALNPQQAEVDSVSPPQHAVPADPLKHTGAEHAEVLNRAHQLMLSSIHNLNTSDIDLEKYLMNWSSVAKLQAVPEKLDKEDYTLLPPIDLFSIQGETVDQTILAFSIERGVVHMTFSRQRDSAVFAVIDACASNQQASWDLAVREFNERPEAQREALIAAHRRSEAELARLYKEMGESRQTNLLEAARAQHGQIIELQKGLLPFYMAVPKKGATAWARRSIGR